jgi:hypothetical protein
MADIQKIAEEIGAKVEIIDPLSQDYLASMEKVGMTFARS